MKISATVRLKIVAITVVAVVGLTGFFGFPAGSRKIIASASGPSASHTNAPGEDNCTTCHTSFPVNSGPGSVSITGIPASYRPGQQVPVTVSVTQEDAVIYGFQLTALDSQGRKAGSFNLPAETPARIQTIGGLVGGQQRTYVEHTIDGLFLPNTFGHNTWTFTWSAPATQVGPVTFYASGNAANSDGTTNGDYIYTTSVTAQAARRAADFDFDGDGKADIGVFRPGTSAEWWISRSADNGVLSASFGGAGDRPVPADYTGDGKTDIAFFRPSTATWYILRSEDNSFYGFPFGNSTDAVAPADYDGDGKADPSVFRDGAWYVLRSSDGGVTGAQFGSAGDKPVPADYDGDGKADFGVYRPNGGTGGEWWILRSTAGLFAATFGSSTDKTVVGDWTGDGKADCAFFRPSDNLWYILRSEDQSFFGFPFGIATDTPAPGDYDGDGRTDAAVFRSSSAAWYVNKSSGGVMSVNFGASGDEPVASTYVK